MPQYRIQAGAIAGTYTAETEAEALDIYARDAGYINYADLEAQHGAVDSITENGATK